MEKFKFLPPDSQTPVDSVGYRDWFYRLREAFVALQDQVDAIDTTISAATDISYVPLALGIEPLTFVSDGAGKPILVPFTP